MAWQRYVALGDSFTEGLDDPDPRADGVFRGWADLTASVLAAQVDHFEYANLAIRGRLYDAIVAEQLEPALAMKPDLISFAAGGNDVLRKNCDPPTLMARFEESVRRLRGDGADVLVFRFANLVDRLPGGKLIAPRVTYLNDAVGRIAVEQGCKLINLWDDEAYANPAMWSVDRLHMSAYGHHRVAAHVLTALGVAVPDGWWDEPERPRPSWARARANDIHWAGTHLAPWIKRRLTGRSSGDHLEPKRPIPGPVNF